MSTNFFDVAKEITRGYASTLEDFPPLHPDEHKWLEEKLGRKLTTKDAQLALKDARLLAAFGMWSAGRRQIEP